MYFSSDAHDDIIIAPTVDAGLNPANDDVIATTLKISTADTPPTFSTIVPIVGRSVGRTTPRVELNQDMIPAVKPVILAAVNGTIILDNAFARIVIPPVLITTFIKTPTPQTRMIVFQPIPANASFSVTTLNNKSTLAIKNPASPTLMFSTKIPTTNATIPPRAKYCFNVNGSALVSTILLTSVLTLYPLYAT